MRNIFCLTSALSLFGCAAARPPLKTVDHVDLQRYMGSWYVIAAIGLPPERKAYNAVETYRLDEKGHIPTVFNFNKGAFDGPAKEFNSKAFVANKSSNSEWRVQFIWPFKAEYLITSLNEDYSQTIVSRTKRDYVWIMARTPEIPLADYDRLVGEVIKQGYDVKNLRKVPQQWPAAK